MRISGPSGIFVGRGYEFRPESEIWFSSISFFRLKTKWAVAGRTLTSRACFVGGNLSDGRKARILVTVVIPSSSCFTPVRPYVSCSIDAV